MKITGIDHIGIPTEDFAASEKFYEDLGFARAAKYEMGHGAIEFYQAGNLLIELIPTDHSPKTEGAVAHFAVRVDNAEEAWKLCEEKGYKMLNDKMIEIPFWTNGQKCFNILGPNQEKVEFVELL